MLSIRNKMTLSFKDHRSTQVENPGEGVAQIFEWGVKAFQTKLPRESPILGFIAFLITSSLKICLRGSYVISPFPITPIYVHLCLRIWPYCHYWPSENCKQRFEDKNVCKSSCLCKTFVCRFYITSYQKLTNSLCKQTTTSISIVCFVFFDVQKCE